MDPKEIKRAIKRIAGTEYMPGIIFTAEVISIEGESCTIDYNGMKLSDVSLSAIINGNTNNMLITPTVGSIVTVADLSDGDKRQLSVISWSEVDTICINAGKLGGLINIKDLTDKINGLVSKVNSLIDLVNTHTHTVATTGTAAAQTGNAAAIVTKAQKATELNFSDYEDVKIKH